MTVSSFLRKTKNVWEKVEDDEESLQFFNMLGEDQLNDDLFVAEKFVCKMYGDRQCTTVNSLRNKLFWKHRRKNG